MTRDLSREAEAFRRDGVTLLKGALSPAALEALKGAYDWSLANPGPGASRIRQKSEGLFYQDLYNPGCQAAYAEPLRASGVADIVAAIWGTRDVWFMYEQVFLKEGGETRRTPWHQDSSYLAVGGEDLLVMWISFDPVPAADALEFVKGSHRGVLYNGSSFDVDDDTAPLHATDAVPRLPDIEARRGDYDIVSWPTEPGDVILFHPATLHGGAATHPGGRRRTLTLRFFGQRSHYEKRPGPAGPRVSGFHDRMTDGAPFRHASFLKLA
ncbi:MAG TPA: phytanoyl-CoA dioxygenase family protein [Caulobacteraceae bacterium]|nr:phytanoyl-CoA dioxygenase family protein [Caulobacteraceae bacterium]